MIRYYSKSEDRRCQRARRYQRPWIAAAFSSDFAAAQEGDSRAGEIRDHELADWEHWGRPLSYGSVRASKAMVNNLTRKIHFEQE